MDNHLMSLKSKSKSKSKSKIEIELWIKSYIKCELGLPVFDVLDNMSNLGIDSIEAIALVGKISDWLEVSIPATLLWECSTFEDFIDEIDYLVNSKVGPITYGSKAEVSGVESDFGRYINPYLELKLKSLNMDKRFVKAEGIRLWDQEGNEYLDFISQYGALPFGHNPKEVWDVMNAFYRERTPSFVQPSLLIEAGSLAKALIDVAPSGLDYVVFTNSGAETVEASFKLARAVTGRESILSTEKGFHGKTIASLSATGNSSYQAPYHLSLDGYKQIPFDNLQELEDTLKRFPEQFAAFIVEPIQGEGGVNVPSADYLFEAKRICHLYGVLLIVDEIQTGMGRTGELFATSDSVEPDMLLLAKALGGGVMPIGACLYSANCYTEEFAITHSSTFAANGLACCVGKNVLSRLVGNEGSMLRHIRDLGTNLKDDLEALSHAYPHIVKSVSGCGLMLGVELELPDKDWNDLGANSFLKVASDQNILAQLVAAYMLNVEKIRVAPTLNHNNVLRVQPALNAQAKDCRQLVDALTRCIDNIASRDLGSFFGSIIDGKRRDCDISYRLNHSQISQHRCRETKSEVNANDVVGRFAFLMHPLDNSSFVDFDASLQALSEKELSLFVSVVDRVLEPFVYSSAIIQASNGQRISGDFILVGQTTESLLKTDDKKVLSTITDALNLGIDRGADIVGLGGYTSILTGGGYKVKDNGSPITSGNSFTALSGQIAIDKALHKLQRTWESSNVAIVGAAGSIGSTMSVMLAEKAGKLILVGNPNRSIEESRRKISAVVDKVLTYWLDKLLSNPSLNGGPIIQAIKNYPFELSQSTSTQELGLWLENSGYILITDSSYSIGYADIVVTATNTLANICEAKGFKQSAIICDLSRPKSISRIVAVERPDLLIIDGGLITLPNRPDIGCFGIDKGLAYACMAETMLLTFGKHFEHTSLGANISMTEIDLLNSLANQFGFEIDQLQSFGETFTDQRFEELIELKNAQHSKTKVA
jgi:acetylornithine/succinyldiaminopimelate/putrescine aminotransferase/predicted amino acid dehydrogenase/acyl carrier protein